MLLAHQPKSVFAAARRRRVAAVGAHARRADLAVRYLVRLQQPFVAGLDRHEGAQLYVSRGTGYWGPPMRLGAPAEITQLVLTCGNEGVAQAETPPPRRGAGNASRPT